MAKKQKKTAKTKRKTFKKIPYRAIIALTFVGLLAFSLYKKRNVIRSYYDLFFTPFTQKYQNNSEFEKAKIEQVVNHHQDKVFGIDISHYQRRRDFNWELMKINTHNIPIDFVVMRATMGSHSKDRNFKHFWKKAKENGYIRGAYHYYRPNEDPIKQANNFVNTINLEKGDLRPILDVEKLPRDKNAKKLVNDIKIFLRLVERKYGVKPILYTYHHFYLNYLVDDLDSYPLWLANYNNINEPTMDWHFWQFTEKGIIDGINTKVDLNVFNGDIDELEKWMIK